MSDRTKGAGLCVCLRVCVGGGGGGGGGGGQHSTSRKAARGREGNFGKFGESSLFLLGWRAPLSLALQRRALIAALQIGLSLSHFTWPPRSLGCCLVPTVQLLERHSCHHHELLFVRRTL